MQKRATTRAMRKGDKLFQIDNFAVWTTNLTQATRLQPRAGATGAMMTVGVTIGMTAIVIALIFS